MAGKSNSFRVRADDRLRFLIVLLAAVFWNALAWPATVVLFRRHELAAEPLLLLVLAFPLVGVVLLYASWRAWKNLIRWGEAIAEYEPSTPRIGDPFAVEIKSSRAVTLPRDWEGLLICERTHPGSDSYRTRAEVWRQQVPGDSDGHRVRFIFNPPASLPPSDASDISWRLIAGAYGERLCPEFSLALAPAAGSPARHRERLLDEAKQIRETARKRAEEPSDLAPRLARQGIRIDLAHNRLQLHPRRHRARALTNFSLAALFGLPALLLLSTALAYGADNLWMVVPPVALMALSAANAAAGLYRVADRRVLQWDDRGGHLAWRHLVGKGQTTWKHADVTGFQLRETGAVRSDNPAARERVALGILTKGTFIEIADAVASKRDAEALAQTLARAWNLPAKAVSHLTSSIAPPDRRTHLIWQRSRLRVWESGIAFAALLFIAASVLRFDFAGWFMDGMARLEQMDRTVPTRETTTREPATRMTPAQRARAFAEETASRPPHAAAVANEVDLGGEWRMHLPAGFERTVALDAVSDSRYRLRLGAAMNGLYELAEGDLAVIEPADARLTGFVWRIAEPGLLVLIEAPPAAMTGADYTGATLSR